MKGLASIRTKECVGCTKCIQVCPVDCIIGSEGYLHHVLEDECIGCGLCVPACPVDCIDLDANAVLSINKTLSQTRHAAKKARQSETRLHYNTLHTQLGPTPEEQKNYILAALARKKNQ